MGDEMEAKFRDALSAAWGTDDQEVLGQSFAEVSAQLAHYRSRAFYWFARCQALEDELKWHRARSEPMRHLEPTPTGPGGMTMSTQYRGGPILDDDADLLVAPVNCVPGVMGAGLARAFAENLRSVDPLEGPE